MGVVGVHPRARSRPFFKIGRLKGRSKRKGMVPAPNFIPFSVLALWITAVALLPFGASVLVDRTQLGDGAKVRSEGPWTDFLKNATDDFKKDQAEEHKRAQKAVSQAYARHKEVVKHEKERWGTQTDRRARRARLRKLGKKDDYVAKKAAEFQRIEEHRRAQLRHREGELLKKSASLRRSKRLKRRGDKNAGPKDGQPDPIWSADGKRLLQPPTPEMKTVKVTKPPPTRPPAQETGGWSTIKKRLRPLYKDALEKLHDKAEQAAFWASEKQAAARTAHEVAEKVRKSGSTARKHIDNAEAVAFAKKAADAEKEQEAQQQRKNSMEIGGFDVVDTIDDISKIGKALQGGLNGGGAVSESDVKQVDAEIPSDIGEMMQQKFPDDVEEAPSSPGFFASISDYFSHFFSPSRQSEAPHAEESQGVLSYFVSFFR